MRAAQEFLERACLPGGCGGAGRQDVYKRQSHYGSTGRTVLWDGGRLYLCSDNRPDDLHWMTPDGQTGELAVAWPEEILHSQGETIFYLERMLPGRLLLTVWGPWGIDRIQRYALDLESGAVQECPLEYVSNASERPIMILAQGEKELAVAFAEQRQQVESVSYTHLDVYKRQQLHQVQHGRTSWF